MTWGRSRGVVVAGALVALVGTFLPWLTSGSVNRTSYELVDLVERLGFASGGAMNVALTMWSLVPLMLVVSIVLAVAARWIAAIVRFAVWAVAGLYVGATAIALLTAPDASLLRTRYGVWVSAVGGIAMLVGTVWGAAGTLRPDRPMRRER